jgi:hypothetical protein
MTTLSLNPALGERRPASLPSGARLAQAAPHAGLLPARYPVPVGPNSRLAALTALTFTRARRLARQVNTDRFVFSACGGAFMLASLLDFFR